VTPVALYEEEVVVLPRTLALLLSLALNVPLSASAADCFEDVSPAEAADLIEGSPNQPVILDVRTEEEFTGRLGHIEGALLVPLDQLDRALPRLQQLADREVIVVCRSGNRSTVASMMLCGAGFTRVTNLSGGMSRWRSAGLPVARE